ncbi:NAD(P)H-dependent oxidoreductase [Dickeya fangzhongdai]|uniref:NADPH-dependent FMN reductase n=1 Tax=Dickeya fangzhongdai TaxID=1778540 RepID=UPI001EFA9F4E|nr:NAD(P)H-dependent oxidoreductase [Dickeya fangzhongdai]ULR32169.1 NAD(P)H-dependent oxidoreductase [Dickeya fangzhongdai]
MHFQIIIGSVRQGRIGPKIARWAKDVLDEIQGKTNEVIDLKEWYLPMDDEPNLPAEGVYVQEHTTLWSRKISEADAYIFIFPQYNWGYPAALKNAIDHLYNEWKDKPAAMISYANRGGGKAAAQLHQVLLGVHMKIIPDNIEIKLSEVNFSDTDNEYPIELTAYQAALHALVRSLDEQLLQPGASD